MKVFLVIVALFLTQDTGTTATIAGRVTMDDGSPLPMVTTFRGPTVQVGLLVTVPDIASRIAEATMNDDGTFQASLTAAGGRGLFTVVVSRMPLGYYVKSMTHGSVDLLRAPLSITPNSVSTPIQLVLSKTPPVGATTGVSVRGRVTNWTLNAPSIAVSLQVSRPDTNGVSVLRLETTNLKPDGSFEFTDVPAGRYRSFATTDSRNDLIGFDVADKDVSGLQITLPNPGVPSITITSVPFVGPGSGLIGGSPVTVIAATALQPSSGSAGVSIAQSGSYGRNLYEGAMSFFRIERSGEILQEKRLEVATPLAFTLAPGRYELSAYSRGCDGNCGRLSAVEMLCSAPLNVTAGEVLYAERVLQNGECRFQFNTRPSR